MLGQPRFQVGNSTVLEPQDGPDGHETFVERAFVGGERAHALFECGVLGGDPLDGILWPFGFQIADAPEEFADASSLSEDLGVGGLECVLSVEGRPHGRDSPRGAPTRIGHSGNPRTADARSSSWATDSFEEASAALQPFGAQTGDPTPCRQRVQVQA
jgi:hypothetical protein